MKGAVERGILPDDPLPTPDRHGVGEPIASATDRGRAARPGPTVATCGGHGGDPAPIAFCHEVGRDHVGCSPFRLPIARSRDGR